MEQEYADQQNLFGVEDCDDLELPFEDGLPL